ncbi:MAG TPA: DASS family sodium-coupled anion symporter, partial [Burkholderiaceae bacterium]|nr:DASS family sodium-coupled anion symporter [Burkholderiaceae bacterium]
VGRPMSLQQKVQRAGLVAGPLLAAALYWALPLDYRAPDGTFVAFSQAGRATLAAMAWMATWWMTEAVAIEVTALLPIALFPLAGIMPLGRTTANYGAEVIYLFFGGFVLALAIARWGLDRRIAFMTLRLVGTRPKAIVAGTMGATAFISMWVSNTATAAMMVPIVLSVIDVALRSRRGKSLAELGGIPRDDRDLRNFALSALLGVAYAASIGGLGTIIGSPPNGILVRFIEQSAGMRVTFLEWMLIGVPAMLTFLPLAWFLNTFVMFPSSMKEIEGGRDYVRNEWARLGPMNAGERATLVVFAITVTLWMTAPLLAQVRIGDLAPLEGLSDAGIAVGAAIALFLIPVKGEKDSMGTLMDWETATRLPWGVLILFGGGLALASATEVNGVPGYIGSLAAGFAGWPFWAVLLALIAIMVFMSELTSNTAQVATMLPILAALAPVLGIPAGILLVPATVAASCAFMMPVGTPPNAIVFGTGLVRMPDMMKAGLWLNLAGILLIFALTYAVFTPVLSLLR